MKDSLDPRLAEQVQKLQQKYAAMGQDLSSYLDGLLYADYLTYWDYIHLDTLLSLQNPKTHFADEKVFIVYHQITELYFNLALWEIEQIASQEKNDRDFFLQRIGRVVRYFRQLVGSFEIMVDGLDKDQFLKFRMSLLPSSGFQSAQYRLIEIASTDLINLVATTDRDSFNENSSVEDHIAKLYWRSGATELATGKKTLTLQQFEDKYLADFTRSGNQYKSKNLYRIYLSNFVGDAEIESALKELDHLANVHWRLAHLKSAARYLHKAPEDIKATGGTNWQKYLPPRFQRIMFFPSLWNATEKEEWGKVAVIASLQA
jgi:tryptophan 2,3-dioxygenase